ncbi:acetyltransferases [Firmicutes bacterium CAG:313]|jgi:acetyltransferases|nr:acetyltransferases [Firmicutes bacterium CAG:313]
MQIRRATLTDIDGINKLLYEVHKVHSDKRPDLFKVGSKKYTNEELAKIIVDDNRPIFVYVDNDDILGYAFCVFIKNNSNSLTDILTLYIDDLCVDENARGKKVGTSLYNYVLQFAKDAGCYNVTLNVWACNNSALKFYEKCGLSVQKIGMEKIL